jgi:hypothetical protein
MIGVSMNSTGKWGSSGIGVCDGAIRMIIVVQYLSGQRLVHYL